MCSPGCRGVGWGGVGGDGVGGGHVAVVVEERGVSCAGGGRPNEKACA